MHCSSLRCTRDWFYRRCRGTLGHFRTLSSPSPAGSFCSNCNLIPLGVGFSSPSCPNSLRTGTICRKLLSDPYSWPLATLGWAALFSISHSSTCLALLWTWLFSLPSQLASLRLQRHLCCKHQYCIPFASKYPCSWPEQWPLPYRVISCRCPG